jgi:hypothetical protein
VASDDSLYAEDVAALLKMGVATWRGYVARGQAPLPDGRDVMGPNVRPYWSRGAIERFVAGRRGPGRRRREARCIYAFQVDGDAEWHGEPAALPDGMYDTAELMFNPANSRLRFAGKRLIVRLGEVGDEIGIPALYVYTTIGNERVRATDKVHELLFGG